MTKEQKELLLKDLCGRLPYGVKILHQGWNYEWDQELSTLERVTGIDKKFIYTNLINGIGDEYTESRHVISLFEDKPYLFPLSSMTEEQKSFFKGKPIELDKYGDVSVKDDLSGGCLYTDLDTYLECIDYLNANHFDYRRLIEQDLAIDATGLGIYKEQPE